MEKNIALFYPDINIHKSHNLYLNNIYRLIGNHYEIRPLEWFFKHMFSRKISICYLNWYENFTGNKCLFIQYFIYIFKILLLLLFKIKRIKVIFVYHNKVPHNIKQESKFYRFVLKRFLRRYLKFANKIIVLSHKSTDYIIKEFNYSKNNKIFFVRHGKFEKYSMNTNVREKYNLKDNELVFSFIGSMNEYKNIDIIIKAFKKANIDSKLLLIGKSSDTYYKVLQDLISNDDRIILDNSYIKDEIEFSADIQASNIGVLPYDYTSLNSAMMINYFSNGVPVITSDIAMTYDFDELLFYKYEFSNEENHISNLCNEMKKAYSDFLEGKLDNKGKMLQKIMEEDYSWDEVEKELINAIV